MFHSRAETQWRRELLGLKSVRAGCRNGQYRVGLSVASMARNNASSLRHPVLDREVFVEVDPWLPPCLMIISAEKNNINSTTYCILNLFNILALKNGLLFV